MLYLAARLRHGRIQDDQSGVQKLVQDGRLTAIAVGVKRLVPPGLQLLGGPVHRQRRRAVQRAGHDFPVDLLHARIPQDRSKIRFVSGRHGTQRSADRLQYGHGIANGGKSAQRRRGRRPQRGERFPRRKHSDRNWSGGQRLCRGVRQQVQRQFLCP